MAIFGFLILLSIFHFDLKTSDGEYEALSLALEYCHYTQGPFPYWLISEEWLDLLEAQDQKSAQKLVKIQIQTLPPRAQKLQKAAELFLSTYTLCEIQTYRLTGARAWVTLVQKVPIIQYPKKLPQADQKVSAYFEAFLNTSSLKHWKKDLLKLQLVKVNTHWKVHVNFRELLEKPIAQGEALDQIEIWIREHQWSKALEALSKITPYPSMQNIYQALLQRATEGQKHWQQRQRDLSRIQLGGEKWSYVKINSFKGRYKFKLELWNRSSKILEALWILKGNQVIHFKALHILPGTQGMGEAYTLKKWKGSLQILDADFVNP